MKREHSLILRGVFFIEILTFFNRFSTTEERRARFCDTMSTYSRRAKRVAAVSTTPVVFQVFAPGGSVQQRDSILRCTILARLAVAVRYVRFYVRGAHDHGYGPEACRFPVMIDGDDEKKKGGKKKRERNIANRSPTSF